MNENLLEAVIANPPKVHQGDAEVGNEKALTGSALTGYMREAVERNLVVCHGIDSEVARFLHRVVAEGARTLETGCGLSTIIFAMRKAHHTVVTPSMREAAAIREGARSLISPHALFLCVNASAFIASLVKSTSPVTAK